MKKQNRVGETKIYSKETIDRINEVHSMILERSGDLNISKIVPNWKNTRLADLEDKIKSFAAFSIKINEYQEIPYAQDPELKKYFSPRWRNSKYGKMTPQEIMDYAYSSPENRKEVRDFVEKEWEWFLKNAPSGIWKSRELRKYDRDVESGLDPYDVYYRSAEIRNSAGYAFLIMLPIILQLLIWLL